MQNMAEGNQHLKTYIFKITNSNFKIMIVIPKYKKLSIDKLKCLLPENIQVVYQNEKLEKMDKFEI